MRRPLLCAIYYIGVSLMGTLAACSRDVVAVVNHEAIHRDELRSAIRIATNKFDRIQIRQPQRQAELKTRVLDELIDSVLIRQAAERAGITIEPTALDAYIAEHKGQYSDASFAAMLTDRQIAEADWRRERERGFWAERYLQHLQGEAAVSDTAIAKYYEAHPERFQEAAAVHVRHILTDSKDTAESIHQELLAGGNFAKLAIDHSIAPESERGGDLGWIERGQFPAVFEESCFRLPTGAVSAVVASEYGYHVFKVLARRPGRSLPLEAVREEIRALLQQEHVTEVLASHLAVLRMAAEITTKPEAIARVALQ